MELVEKFKEFFDLDIPWAICGGYAIDLFLDKKTRDHKDLDITVFWQDRDKIIEFMLENNWRVFEPDQGRLREITSLDNDLKTEDNLWCLSKDNDSYNIFHIDGCFFDISPKTENQTKLDFIEFLFSDIKDSKIIYKRNIDIKINMEKAIRYYKDEIPYLTPEMILLYKSSAITFNNQKSPYDNITIRNYKQDFDITINKLNKEQILWLYQSLKASYSDTHDWIIKLENL